MCAGRYRYACSCGMPFISFEMESFIGLEFINWSRLVGQKAPGNYLWDYKYAPHLTFFTGIFTLMLRIELGSLCKSETLQTDPSSQLSSCLCFFFKDISISRYT